MRGRRGSFTYCAIPGCSNRSHGHGLCLKHYGRIHRNGDPLKLVRNPMGGGGLDADGYWVTHKKGVRMPQHIQIAEKALGKQLPKDAQVHHVNEKRLDNVQSNLVICQNNAYHRLLHRRMGAIKAGMPARFRKCGYCHSYDDPLNLYLHGSSVHHRKCKTDYDYRRKKEATNGIKEEVPTQMAM